MIMRPKIKVDFLSVGLGIAVGGVAVLLFAAYRGDVETVSAVDSVDFSRATLLVKGMGCKGCPSQISRGVQRLDGDFLEF